MTETDDGGVDTTVCGTDRKNYHSLCAMLQEMGNLKVSYAGQCNRTECLGGTVSLEYLYGYGRLELSFNHTPCLQAQCHTIVTPLLIFQTY